MTSDRPHDEAFLASKPADFQHLITIAQLGRFSPHYLYSWLNSIFTVNAINNIPQCKTIVTVSCGLLEVASAKPWPTYSLENMPRTSFTCRDKILGGYYADAETQCQMFHVQDFRFLCPNGTAFDQEAQICADWGDVDCEAATLYYGSDNFDLYRIGSGFESKRAPFAEEEEATFHLQRAETGDARRGKQVIVNQSKNSQSFGQNTFNRPVVTTKATTQLPQTSSQPPQVNRNEFSYTGNYFPGVSRASEYRPTPPSTTTTTAKPLPVAPNFPDNQRFGGNDEIFRGSHSSNFFNNRNNGKEDYENDFSTSAATSTVRPRQASVRIRQRGRSRFSSSLNNISTAPDKVASSTVASTKLISPTATAAPSSLPPYLGSQGTFSFTSRDAFRPTPPRASPQPAVVTFRPQQQQPQQNFQAVSSTVKPVHQESSTSREIFKIPSSTPAYTTLNRQQNFKTSAEPQHSPSPLISYSPYSQDVAKSRQSPDFTSNFSEKKTTLQQSSNFQAPTTQKPVQTPAQNDVVSFNFNNFQGQSARTQLQPQQQTFPQDSRFNPHTNYDLTAVQQSKFTYNPYQTNKVSPPATSSPIPSSTATNFYSTAAPVQSSSPRGFTALNNSPIVTTPKPLINYDRYQTVSRSGDNYTPSTVKKFSTLVPKELYDPTTFKPTTYKKPVDAFAAIKASQVEQAKTANPIAYNKFSAASYLPSTSTQAPGQKVEIDEDDGQYHPELYEKDFPRHKIGHKRKFQKTTGGGFQFGTNYQPTAATLPPANSAEDEFLKTAHSQNIAASGNELRVEKEKARLQATTKSASRSSTFSKAPTIPPNATSTKRPPQAAAAANDRDASYDYQYYDTFPESYQEYDIIEDFGKTKSKKH
ncbi:uncharacterized protein LOC132264512 [Phlebotomus argentipes]|uniref:uncharacterized protein LOC132264512 n=1 Tax=Phlebotomus argentipes TaxID=94469 RepID=UPI0028932465|nr:uncharacterized protein LOC132264512 [Phlebotomus argentipes]